MPVIDAHCHYGKGDLLTDPATTDASLSRYLLRARRAGIEGIVLFPALNNNYEPANRKLFQFIKSSRWKFYGFAFLHPVRDEGRVSAVLKKLRQNYHCHGIKIHKHDGHITREICDCARSIRLPILYDVCGDIPHLDLIAREYPDVNFIIPHLGSYNDDWKSQLFLIDLLVRFPNIYADTSGVRNFEILAEAVRRAGAGKIIFGSDGPWLNPEIELFKIRALRLDKAEEEKITGKNILKLISKV